MTEQLKELAKRAEKETTATEAMETTLEVATLSEGEDPVRFLLKKLLAVEKQNQNLRRQWNEVQGLVQDRQDVADMIGSGPGDDISSTLRTFLFDKLAERNGICPPVRKAGERLRRMI